MPSGCICVSQQLNSTHKLYTKFQAKNKQLNEANERSKKKKHFKLILQCFLFAFFIYSVFCFHCLWSESTLLLFIWVRLQSFNSNCCPSNKAWLYLDLDSRLSAQDNCFKHAVKIPPLCLFRFHFYVKILN